MGNAHRAELHALSRTTMLRLNGLEAGAKRLSVHLAEGVFRHWPDRVVQRDLVPVFMLHRFSTPDGLVKGHESHRVAEALEFLRRNGYRVLSIDSLVEQALLGSVPDRAVAFTIDDGYYEQGQIAAELFLAHDCPVTIFLTTGLTDGTFWPVEAKVAHLFSSLSSPRQLRIAGTTLELDPGNSMTLRNARRAFVHELKELPIADAVVHLANTAELLGVALPAKPPASFAPLTWPQARALEARGVRFGAHTVRHVTLSREDDATAKAELADCAARLGDELRDPSRVLCYPTGRRGDYGQRDRDLARTLGFMAAVSAEPGYVALHTMPDSRFDLTRFAFPDSLVEFKDIVLQVHRLRDSFRQQMRRGRR